MLRSCLNVAPAGSGVGLGRRVSQGCAIGAGSSLCRRRGRGSAGVRRRWVSSGVNAGRSEAKFAQGLTFDDVLLVPTLSSVTSRRDIDLRTRLTPNIELRLPLVASNMDSVCESPMAIAMAKAGGMGIIHRYLSVEQQVAEVEAVKRDQSYIISQPYTIGPDATVSQLRHLMLTKGVKSFLITKPDSRRLLGIVTSRDLRFVSPEDESALLSGFATPLDRLVTAPPTISASEAAALLHKHRIEKLPLVDADGCLTGLISGRDLLKPKENPLATLDTKAQLRVGAAIGVKSGDIDRALALQEAGCDVIVVDIAHGHSLLAINAVKELKKLLSVEIIAGNVATAEGAQALIDAGASAIKVGVGPGSICITRIVTGCGVPQLTAILDAASVANAAGIPIIADGGIRTSGDITKALAAGADTVMLGSALAGTDETPGQTLVKGGKKVKIIRGMAGFGANMANRERQAMRTDDIFEVVPEGVEGQVPYRGPVVDILHQLSGGLASGVSYCGGTNLDEMRRNAKFIRMTGAGKAESGSHDVSLL